MHYIILLIQRMVMLMNKLGMASTIRTSCAEMLARKRSIKRMQNSLIELFVDRTKDDKPVNLFDNGKIRQILRYSHCKSLNDKKIIEFHQSFKQEDDVFDEDRQIWISSHIDPIKDDLFIPRDDAQ